MKRAEALKWDGYDDAIVGYAMVKRDGRYRHCIVYSLNLLHEITKAGMSAAEGDDLDSMAEEYVEFNILGAYIGPNTPIVVDRWL